MNRSFATKATASTLSMSPRHSRSHAHTWTIAVASLLTAATPTLVNAAILEVTLTGTVLTTTLDGPLNSKDVTNVFGFGVWTPTNDTLGGRTVVATLLIDVGTAPAGIDWNPLTGSTTGTNYWDANGAHTNWLIPGFSFVDSSLSIGGNAAPDFVSGAGNYENQDLVSVNEGGAYDYWTGQDMSHSIDYPLGPTGGQYVGYLDMLTFDIWGADFLSGTNVDQTFTLTGGGVDFFGTGSFRYGLVNNLEGSAYQYQYAEGNFEIQGVTAKLLDSQPPPETTVPEPATLALLGLGLAVLGLGRRRKA